MSKPLNTEKLDSIIDEVGRSILLDLGHFIEGINGRKTGRLVSQDEIALLDFMFKDELYPISDDSDYLELDEIFSENI
jgi:hypothetical protein